LSHLCPTVPFAKLSNDVTVYALVFLVLLPYLIKMKSRARWTVHVTYTVEAGYILACELKGRKH
jgi:hypothetical protein